MTDDLMQITIPDNTNKQKYDDYLQSKLESDLANESYANTIQHTNTDTFDKNSFVSASFHGGNSISMKKTIDINLRSIRNSVQHSPNPLTPNTTQMQE
jgi:hypothetical protein